MVVKRSARGVSNHIGFGFAGGNLTLFASWMEILRCMK
jgi:hypothetical protein